MTSRIFTASEFAPLKTMVLAQSEMLFPKNESTYIMDPAFADIGAQLQARGIAVEYIDFAISRSLGGSFRCSTQPLWREG